MNSDVERPLSPVTAAGPRRTRTVFPVARMGDPQGYGPLLLQHATGVKGNVGRIASFPSVAYFRNFVYTGCTTGQTKEAAPCKRYTSFSQMCAKFFPIPSAWRS